MTSAELIDVVSKTIAVALGAYGALSAWRIKQDEARRRAEEAEARRIKAAQDAAIRAVENEKLRADITADVTEGYHREIKRLQDRADKQDARIDAQDKEIARLRAENELYRRWNQMMAAHIAANNLPPVPMPEK